MKSSFSLLIGAITNSCLLLTAHGAVLSVSGTDTIYGAGLSAAPGAGTLPPSVEFAAAPGQTLFVQSVTGTVTSGPSFGPDGEGPQTYSTAMDSYLGLSGIQVDKAFFLMGVFLDDAAPTGEPPPTLDFRSTGLSRDFTTLSPLIGQTFYVGDGRIGEGGAGAMQAFVVPATATRLFLGIADGQFDGARVFGQPGNYHDNGGAFTVNLTVVGNPCVAQVSIHVSQVDVCWNGCSNRLYQVQYRSPSTTNDWADLGAPIKGNGGTNTFSDPVPLGAPRRFYRVLTLP